MNDREKSPGAPDAQIPPPRHPKFEHLGKRFFSQMFGQALRTYRLTGCPIYLLLFSAAIIITLLGGFFVVRSVAGCGIMKTQVNDTCCICGSSQSEGLFEMTYPQYNYPGTFAILAVDVLTFPVILHVTGRLLECSMWKLSRPTLFPTLSMLVMAGAVMVFRLWVWNERTYLCFFATAAVGGLAYLGVSYLFERLFGYGIRRTVLEQIATMRK